MIRSFVNKGLKKFFETGSTAGIQPAHKDKISNILATLDKAKIIHDMNLPGFGLHPLHGNRKGIWAVTVNKNWRITFKFENGDAFVVDYEDYH